MTRKAPQTINFYNMMSFAERMKGDLAQLFVRHLQPQQR